MPGKEKWRDQEEIVAEWLGEGQSYAAVADATGIPKGTLWGIAKRVQTRQTSPGLTSPRTRRIWTAELCRLVLELRDQGMTYAAISRRTGVPSGSIRRCLAVARAAETHVLEPAVALPEATRPAQPPEPRPGEPDVPSPEEYVLAFVEYVEGERRRLREANRELAEAVDSLREQLDVARESAAAAAREVNDYVFANKAWREKLSLLGKVVPT